MHVGLSLILVLLLLGPSGAAFAEPDLPDVSGRWAQKHVKASLVDLPLIGETRSETRALVLLEVRQKGDRLELVEEVCQLRVVDDAPAVRTIIPGRFVTAVSGQKRKARLYRSDTGVHYHQTRQFSVLGADLDDPTQDALPATTDDARLVDPDRDGKPGATILIRGIVDGDIYVVHREWTALRGRIEDDGSIEGVVDWNEDRTIVDATKDILKTVPSSRPHPRARDSYFQMVRVPADIRCNQLIEQANALFAR